MNSLQMVTESLSPHFLSLSLALEAVDTDDIVGLLLLSQSLDQPDDLGPLLLDLVRAEPVVQILHVLRELSDARIDLAGCKMRSGGWSFTFQQTTHYGVSDHFWGQGGRRNLHTSWFGKPALVVARWAVSHCGS